MSKTVAEILVDQMVDVGIRNVYGIVGDSANPIVDAMRRHTADINFVHVRNEEAGAFAAGADAQVSGRPAAVLGSSGPGQRPPAERALRLPAKRLAGVRDRNPHPQHRDRHGLLPGDRPDGHVRRLLQLRRDDQLAGSDAAAVPARAAGGDPRPRRRDGDPSRRHRRRQGRRSRCSNTPSSPIAPSRVRPTRRWTRPGT